ncbi:hypothetical protein BKA81DRAFT_345595, partial [Phyllosticta paracitricarpa]
CEIRSCRASNHASCRRSCKICQFPGNGRILLLREQTFCIGIRPLRRREFYGRYHALLVTSRTCHSTIATVALPPRVYVPASKRTPFFDSAIVKGGFFFSGSAWSPKRRRLRNVLRLFAHVRMPPKSCRRTASAATPRRACLLPICTLQCHRRLTGVALEKHSQRQRADAQHVISTSASTFPAVCRFSNTSLGSAQAPSYPCRKLTSWQTVVAADACSRVAAGG